MRRPLRLDSVVAIADINDTQSLRERKGGIRSPNERRLSVHVQPSAAWMPARRALWTRPWSGFVPVDPRVVRTRAGPYALSSKLDIIIIIVLVVELARDGDALFLALRVL